ncbi:MAG: alpha/beta hydrolase [Chitinophagales bacterium]
MKKAPLIIHNTNKTAISLDVWYPEAKGNYPVVIFAHGFKGFKDWGHFGLLMQQLVDNNMVVVKFNFSGNGTTPEFMTDFVDLEKFGNNNWSIELGDLNTVVDFVEDNIVHYHGDKNNINLIGHSRGGGISILQTAKDHRIKKLITWASVASFDYFIDAIDIQQWENDGVVYTYNGRTKQNMPLYYQLYEDYIKNKSNLNIL